MKRGRTDEGFTLVELLIVIVILGVLAAVVVFAVGGITDRGDEVATTADAQTISDAQEAYKAINGSYAEEAELVAAGLLRDQSTVHDVTVAADRSSFTLVATGAGGSGGGGGPTTTTIPSGPTTTVSPTTTTTTLPAGPVPTSYAGFSGESIGSGSQTLVILGTGSGLSATLWTNLQASPFPNTEVIWLNAGDINETADVDAIIASNPTYMIAAQAVSITNSSNGSNTYVGAYMATLMSSPDDFWWMQSLGVPTMSALDAYL